MNCELLSATNGLPWCSPCGPHLETQVMSNELEVEEKVDRFVSSASVAAALLQVAEQWGSGGVSGGGGWRKLPWQMRRTGGRRSCWGGCSGMAYGEAVPVDAARKQWQQVAKLRW
jgi:hypothetical protein